MTGRTEQPRIVILGGGIGGLAAAAFLHRAGLEAQVYEQAPALTEVGAGLVVAPNAARLLRRLGVLGAFRERAVQMDVGWEFRRWEDGTVLSAEDLAERCEPLYGEQTYVAHRADLLNAIRSAVPEEWIHLNAQCTGVDLDGEHPVLRFADGSIVEADVLIGADGIHSQVRGALFGPSPATFSGMCAFRALVPIEKAPEFSRRPAHTLWLGPDHHLVHYPISGGEYVNLVAVAPAGDYSTESWTATATVEQFLAEFEGWDPRLIELISSASQIGRWVLLDRAPLKQWGKGSVTLLGDAAHPMFPFFAQGAAQSIEDAEALASCLAAEPGGPESALRRYESMRIPRTTKLQELSHERATINHLPDGPEQQARDKRLAESDALVANGWIYKYDLEGADA